MRLTVWAVACAVALALPALAQDDDLDLAPLVPTKPKAKPKPKPKVQRAVPKAQPKVQPRAEDDELAPLVAQKAELLVRAPLGMTGAVLLIDGKEVGTLPLGAQSLPVGEHQVMVKRKAYAVFVKKVTLVAGKSLEVQAALQPVSALLTVNSDVEAEVFVNGKLIGTTPITDHELPASTIELAVRKEGYRDEAQRLVVVAGREYPVSVNMRSGGTTTLVASGDAPVESRLTPTESSSEPPLTLTESAAPTPVVQRWYFWAGVAAVVAAGVTAGVVIGTQKPVPLRSDEVCIANGGKCSACINFATCATAGAVPWGSAQPVLSF